MRAAHSVKGAARVVQLEAAVRLAHVMEDALVAAQHGRHRLSSDDVELLLQGTDALARIAKHDAGELQGHMTAQHVALHELTHASGLTRGGRARVAAAPVPGEEPPAAAVAVPASVPAAAAAAAPTAAPPPPSGAKKDDAEGRTLRITAGSLNRIM